MMTIMIMMMTIAIIIIMMMMMNSMMLMISLIISSSSEFFQELFHPDHDATDLYAVILQVYCLKTQLCMWKKFIIPYSKLLSHFTASCTIGWYDGYSRWSDSIYECLLSWRYVIIIICITYTVTIYLSYPLNSANIIISIIIMSFWIQHTSIMYWLLCYHI